MLQNVHIQFRQDDYPLPLVKQNTTQNGKLMSSAAGACLFFNFIHLLKT